MKNDDIKTFFKKQLAFYYKNQDKFSNKEKAMDNAIEFAFYDLKNKFMGNLDMSILVEIPELRSYLLRNPIGEKSSFHFGKQNSPITQLNDVLSQKYI